MASYDAFEPLFTNQFIGGEWTASSSPNRIAVENPATLEKFAEIPDGTVEDIDRAVDAAYEALPAWRATPLEKRRALMLRFLEHFKAMRQAIIDLEAISSSAFSPTSTKSEKSSLKSPLNVQPSFVSPSAWSAASRLGTIRLGRSSRKSSQRSSPAILSC